MDNVLKGADNFGCKTELSRDDILNANKKPVKRMVA